MCQWRDMSPLFLRLQKEGLHRERKQVCLRRRTLQLNVSVTALAAREEAFLVLRHLRHC